MSRHVDRQLIGAVATVLATLAAIACLGPTGSASASAATGPHTVSEPLVPDVRCLTTSEAVSDLAELGFGHNQGSDDVFSGIVVDQSPPAGTDGTGIDEVALTVADPLVVPDLGGLTFTEAMATATGSCLKLDTTDPTDNTVVVEQSPVAGVPVDPGGLVIVSMGLVVVPGSPFSPPPDESDPPPSDESDASGVVQEPSDIGDPAGQEALTEPLGWWTDRSNQLLIVLVALLLLLALLGSWLGNERVRSRRDRRWLASHVTVAAAADPDGSHPTFLPAGDGLDAGIAFVVVRRHITTRLEELP